MDDSAPTPDLAGFEGLHAHAGFVKRLARQLLRDEDAADDAVQETWLAALRNAPSEAVEARSWLARVLRNRVALRRREARHRSDRERVGARPEAVAGGARALEELEIHRHLVEAVLALREPYRTTIVLRFFEERAPGEVARLARVPVETVRTRTRRGLEELRATLDREHDGDRSAWMSALLPLVGARELAVSGVALGGLAVTTTMMKWAMCGAAILIGALLWQGAVGGGEEREERSEAAGTALELPTVAVRGPQIARVDTASETERRALAATSTALLESALVSTALEGTIEVVDEQGRVHAAEDGRVLFVLPGGRPADYTMATVRAGHWRLEDPPGHALAVSGVNLGGRLARVEPSESRLTGDPPYALRATWIPRTWLRVVDRASGVELDEVFVYYVEGWEAGVFHPTLFGPQERIANGAPSPVELPSSRDIRKYWVRATDHAWRRIAIDPRQGGEHRVELDAGATLEVSTTAAADSAPWQIRLYPAGFDEAAPRYVTLDRTIGKTTVIRGLPAGPLQVRAEIGEWNDPPLELARAEIELAAGEVERLTLDLDASVLGVEAGPVSGVIALPPGLAPEGTWLRLHPARGPEVRPGDGRAIGGRELRPTGVPREYSWEATELSVGRHRLSVAGLQLTQMLDVPPGGLHGVRVVVPELCQVVARAVDALTGEALPVEQIGWSRFEPGLATFGDRAPGSESERALRMEYLHPRDELGTVRFRAPVGRILVGSGLDGYDEDGAWFELESGMNEIELPLEPRCTLVVGFTVDGRDVGRIRGYRVVPVGHDGEWHLWSREGHRYLGTADAPGLYRVEGEPEGYLPIDPKEVRLSRGQRAELEIPLVPVR